MLEKCQLRLIMDFLLLLPQTFDLIFLYSVYSCDDVTHCHVFEFHIHSEKNPKMLSVLQSSSSSTLQSLDNFLTKFTSRFGNIILKTTLEILTAKI